MRILLSLILLLVLFRPAIADKDWILHRKDVYIALDDSFESKLLYSELTRDWQKNNGLATPENAVKAAEIALLQFQLKSNYNFIFLDNNNQKDMDKLSYAVYFPCYKLSRIAIDWYQFDKRAFLSSTYCIRYLDVILNEPLADSFNEQKLSVEQELVARLRLDKWSEIKKECVKVFGPEDYEYNTGCGSIWGFNGYIWEKIIEAPPGKRITSPSSIMTALEGKEDNATKYTDYDYINNIISEIYSRHSARYYDEHTHRYRNRYKYTYYDIKKLKINLELPGECFKHIYITRKNFPWEKPFKYRPD